jgi:hypothetical protein
MYVFINNQGIFYSSFLIIDILLISLFILLRNVCVLTKVANHFVILERLAKKIQQGDNLEIRDFRSEESFRIRFQIDISPSPSLLR